MDKQELKALVAELLKDMSVPEAAATTPAASTAAPAHTAQVPGRFQLSRRHHHH